jgi:hypothetical protein
MNPTVVEKIKSSEVEKIIKEKYGDLLKSKEFYIYNSIKYPSINFFQQYYKVWRANELKNRHKELSNVQYDIVFKLRYDLLFFNKLDFKKVLKVVSEGNFLSNISIYDNTSKQTGLNSYFSQPFIISDYIAFGSENIIDIYSNAFINFDKIFTSKYKIEKKLKNIIILGIDFLFDKFCKCIYFLS